MHDKTKFRMVGLMQQRVVLDTFMKLCHKDGRSATSVLEDLITEYLWRRGVEVQAEPMPDGYKYCSIKNQRNF